MTLAKRQSLPLRLVPPGHFPCCQKLHIVGPPSPSAGPQTSCMQGPISGQRQLSPHGVYTSWRQLELQFNRR